MERKYAGLQHNSLLLPSVSSSRPVSVASKNAESFRYSVQKKSEDAIKNAYLNFSRDAEKKSTHLAENLK